MFKAGRRTKDRVAAAEKASDPVREVSHGVSIVAIRRAQVEQIAVDIRCNHNKLIDETNKQWLVLTRPGSSHCLLHNIVSHAVGDQRHLCFAWFRRILYRLLLLLYQPIKEHAENVC